MSFSIGTLSLCTERNLFRKKKKTKKKVARLLLSGNKFTFNTLFPHNRQ